MRKRSLLVVFCFFGLCLSAACASAAPDDKAPEPLLGYLEAAEIEAQPEREEVILPTELSPTPLGATPPTEDTPPADLTTEEHELPIFDPYDPEGWWDESVYFDSAETGLTWINKDKKITAADSHIGRFRLGMGWSSAVPYFPSKTYTENEWNEDYLTIKTIVFDTLALEFTHTIYGDTSFILTSVYINGGAYVTPRGLAVGDAVDKLFELYGTPACVSDSVWHYYDDHGYDMFQAIVIDNVIQTIHINQIV